MPLLLNQMSEYCRYYKKVSNNDYLDHSAIDFLFMAT